jgi:hypothetical protein
MEHRTKPAVIVIVAVMLRPALCSAANGSDPS